MHTDLIHIIPESPTAPSCVRVISFRPFLNYIKGIRDKTNSHKKYFFSHVVEQFEQNPEILDSVSIEKIKNYEGLMELIYNCLSGMIEDEEVNYWALSMPMRPTVFYSTNAFYKLVSAMSVDSVCNVYSTIGSIKIEGNPLEFVYSAVLEKYYGIPAFFNRQDVHAAEDPETGLTRYYQADLDTRFIEIISTTEMPELRLDILKSANYDRHEKMKWIQEALPLDHFRFEGFGITTITDVSVKYALENIKNFLLNHNMVAGSNYFSDVIHWMKIIVGNNDIEFGLLPALHVNNNLVFNQGLSVNSFLINAAKKKGMEENNYLEMVDKYFKKPKLIFFSEITGPEAEEHSYLKLLAEDGIVSYALIPVYFGGELVGVLEVYSRKTVMFNEILLGKLDPVVPLLSQLLKNGIHEFHDGIDKVIKDKFTSVQPSVQWKFNEAAWHFIRDQQVNETSEIENIHFENVYPLYGAIDIRNSTIERNTALNSDMQVQFTILISMLEKLKKQSAFGLIDEKIFLSKKWLADIIAPANTDQVSVDDFLENNIIPFLHDFKKANKAFAGIMDEYFHAINDKSGRAYEKRRELERAMNTVINAVNKYLEKMKDEVQEAYPSYFEKFRTDGVEYDIYIGQSIAPLKLFSDIYLKNLRLLQLKSMASIAKLTAKLACALTKNVRTTQLIFIYSQPISIQFRTDEKRFDVEGAYNIRYHVVKKRIDKVLVKGSSERLTQPDKIALVYANQQDANEYISYIHYLQGQNILSDDLEELDLEELQGVNGLKALRVGVVIEEKVPDAGSGKAGKNLLYPNPVSKN